MSKDPKGRPADLKKAPESNIEQPEPLDKQDPTQPVEVGKQEDPVSRKGSKSAP